MRQAPRRRAVVSVGDNQVTRRHKPDYGLLVISVVLLAIGLIAIYSISPGLAAQKHVSQNYFVIKQLTAIALGVLSFIAMATIPYQRWRQLVKPLAIAAAVATTLALVLPVSPEYPAHRWIRFGGLSLQSVELVKFTLLIAVAAFLADRIRRGDLWTNQTYKYLGGIFMAAALVVGVLQRDLGSTTVMLAMVGAMCFVAGLPLKRLALVVGLLAIAGALLVLPFSYRRDRLLNFTHPEKNCQTSGYQACQALIAVGSGGLFGRGIAHSVEDYGYLPEAANDSIFAILGEKFGFVGLTVLICLFGAFFARLKHLLERAPDMFARLLLTGILAWLSTQAIINIGAMIGLLPLKGITLPFISYGGTSIIFVTAAIGLAFNISRYTTYAVNVGEGGQPHESTDRRWGNRRPYYPERRRS